MDRRHCVRMGGLHGRAPRSSSSAGPNCFQGQQSRWRRSVRGLALLTLIAAVTACQGTAPSASPSVAITVAGEAGGPYTQFYKEASAEFARNTGISVNWIEVPHDNMHERFLTEAVGCTGAIDVFQADQPWVAEFADKGYLEPLTSKLPQADRGDFLPVALDTVSYKGNIYALPYLVHNSVLYYRTDLLQDAGFTDPPTTWDEYRQVARTLTDPAAGIYGTVMEGKQGIEPAAKFLDLLQQAGGAVLDDSGKVVFDSQATIDAFQFMLDIQYQDQSSPPGAPGFDNADTHNLFMQGKLAMAPNWPYMYALANDPSSSKVVGKFKVALQPGRNKQAAAVFSWGYAVSTCSKHKDAAWSFVSWATSKEMLVSLGEKFTNPVPRRSALDAIRGDPSLSEEAREAIAIMTDSVARSTTIPSNPHWPDLHSRIAVALSRIMTRQATPEDEVRAAAADMRKVLGQGQ